MKRKKRSASNGWKTISGFFLFAAAAVCCLQFHVCWMFFFFCLKKLQSAFGSKEAYFKTIGYQEHDGKIESTGDYLKRLESYMKLYGALVQVCCLSVLWLKRTPVLHCWLCSMHYHVDILTPFISYYLRHLFLADKGCLFWQTEIQGIQNTHGPKEGWAWLARFLNTLPANIYTAVALKAFLQVSWYRFLMHLYNDL